MTTNRPGGNPMRIGAVPAIGVGLLVAAADFLGLLPGWWWLTSVVAFLVTVLLRGAAVFWWVVLGSLIGWTAMLVWHGGSDITRIADLVGAIALNAGGLGWAVIGLTYLVVLLLALTAGWLGGQLRRLVTGPAAAAS